eukprot:scaffold24884_cov67-Phaeocystis_antarctica.AAC.3
MSQRCAGLGLGAGASSAQASARLFVSVRVRGGLGRRGFHEAGWGSSGVCVLLLARAGKEEGGSMG